MPKWTVPQSIHPRAQTRQDVSNPKFIKKPPENLKTPILSIPKQHEDYRDERKGPQLFENLLSWWFGIWFWDQPADQKPKWRIPIFCFKASDKVFWFRIFQFEKFFAVRRKRYSIVLLHGRIIIYSNIIYHCHQKLKKGRRPTARCLRSLDFCCIFIPTCSKSHGFPTTLTNVCAFVLVVCSTVKQESYHGIMRANGPHKAS